METRHELVYDSKSWTAGVWTLEKPGRPVAPASAGSHEGAVFFAIDGMLK